MIYLKKYPRRKLLLFIGDFIFIAISLGLSCCILTHRLAAHYHSMKLLKVALFMATFYLISFYIFDLYDIRSEFKTIQNLIRIGSALMLVSLMGLIFFSIFPLELWKRLLLINLVLTGLFISGWRLSFSHIFRLTIPHRNILIIGSQNDIVAIRGILDKYPEYRIRAAVSDISSMGKPKKPDRINASLEKIIMEHHIDDIIVAHHQTWKSNLRNELITLKMKNINIYDPLTLFEDFLFKVPISSLKEQWIFDHRNSRKTVLKNYQNLKRIFDIVISTGLLIVLLPLILIISISIKLSSKGSVFFIQERMGQAQVPFSLIKFRTMIQHAEDNIPKWADKNDLRATVIGSLLRRFRFDEIPQLINVLKGEMSIVGPRPERHYFVRNLTKKIPCYSLRFSVKPGITGWAQVHLGYTASEKEAMEKLEYDLFYIKNMSLFLDIKILLKTFKTILFGKGR